MTKPNSEPLLDLRRLVFMIRRARRVWMVAGLLGLLAGALLTFLIPPTPTAVARLLITHEGDQPTDDGSFMKTDVAMLETTRIAAAALQTLGVNENPDDFLKSYKAVGLTNNVLEVTIRGSSDDDAVARAKAVADAFIADHVQRTRSTADALTQALTDRQNQTQAELAEVEAALAATPRTVTGEAAVTREGLITRRAELSAQYSDFARRAGEAAIGAPQVAAGTRVVDGPRALERSLLVSSVVNAGLGLGLGLTAGLVLAAVASVVRDRPMLRSEIATHLGASVIAQLPSVGRRRHGSQAVAQRKRVAATLVRAVAEGPPALSLLELGCPRTAAALAVDTARKLAIDSPVVVVDGLPGRPLRTFAGKSGNRVGPIRVQDIEDADHQHGPVWPGTRLIGVGSVAPGTAWTDLGRLGSETVLVVHAGHTSTAWLHTVARQLADCEILVIGVVLVDPEPWDRSDGTLWDGLHEALPGRALPGRALRGRALRDRALRDAALSDPALSDPALSDGAARDGGPGNVALTPGRGTSDD